MTSRLTTILPALSLAEALETTRSPCVAGRTGARTAVVTTRPFRAPHHTISDVGLIGGGQIPLPGEVSLAHRGSLLLEELPEFKHISSKSCANHWSKSLPADHVPQVIDLAALGRRVARPCRV
jgi:predicted ATPase with chaperone activity